MQISCLVFIGTSFIWLAGVVSCSCIILMPLLRLRTNAHTLYHYLYEVAAALFF